MNTLTAAAILLCAIISYGAANFTGAAVSRQGFPLPNSKRRLGCIDGLRGCLALSVMIHHFVIWLRVTRLDEAWNQPSANLINQLGVGAVGLFFMTTGFVFYPKILSGFGSCSWTVLYTMRFFRITPLIAPSVGFILLIISLRTGHMPQWTDYLAAARWVTVWFPPMGEPPLLGDFASGRLNAYVLWSLSYEWIFYLFVLPTCAIAMDIVRPRFPSWIVPAVLLSTTLVLRVTPLSASISVLRYLPLFAIGMLAHEWADRASIAHRLRSPTAAAVAAAVLGFGMALAPTPFTFAMPLFGFLFVCVACGNSMGGILVSKGVLVMGECSYSIYLLHGILLDLLFVDGRRLTGVFSTECLPVLMPAVALVVMLVTPLTYLLVERPALHLGRRFAGRITDRRLRVGICDLETAP